MNDSADLLFAVSEIQAYGGLTAAIDIDPTSLNVKSGGRWITCYIAPPEGYELSEFDVETILLEHAIRVQRSHVEDDMLVVKFDRQEAITYILSVAGIVPPAAVTLIVSGTVAGLPFTGSDVISVR